MHLRNVYWSRSWIEMVKMIWLQKYVKIWKRQSKPLKIKLITIILKCRTKFLIWLFSWIQLQKIILNSNHRQIWIIKSKKYKGDFRSNQNYRKFNPSIQIIHQVNNSNLIILMILMFLMILMMNKKNLVKKSERDSLHNKLWKRKRNLHIINNVKLTSLKRNSNNLKQLLNIWRHFIIKHCLKVAKRHSI